MFWLTVVATDGTSTRQDKGGEAGQACFRNSPCYSRGERASKSQQVRGFVTRTEDATLFHEVLLAKNVMFIQAEIGATFPQVGEGAHDAGVGPAAGAAAVSASFTTGKNNDSQHKQPASPIMAPNGATLQERRSTLPRRRRLARSDSTLSRSSLYVITKEDTSSLRIAFIIHDTIECKVGR